MATVKVYRVKTYDIISDEYQLSRRMATRDGAKIMRGEVLENTEQEIDSSELESGEQWTRRDFGLPRL